MVKSIRLVVCYLTKCWASLYGRVLVLHLLCRQEHWRTTLFAVQQSVQMEPTCLQATPVGTWTVQMLDLMIEELSRSTSRGILFGRGRWSPRKSDKSERTCKKERFKERLVIWQSSSQPGSALTILRLTTFSEKAGKTLPLHKQWSRKSGNQLFIVIYCSTYRRLATALSSW